MILLEKDMIINLISLYIGLQNLELNQKQVDGLMKEMTDTQNRLFEKIIEQNEEILKILKER